MIRILGKIPKNITIACSGGLDSMAITNFLLEGRRKIKLAYFNHDTFHSNKAQKFVEEYALKNSLPLSVGNVIGQKGRRSLEEFWRDERYKFLNNLKSDFIITCHHLDDCVETWIMSSMHGAPKLIPYKRDPNIFRPFLMSSRKKIEEYATDRNLSWIEDPSNQNTKFIRNLIRHDLMPGILKINPGIRTTVRKKVLELYKKI